MTGRRPERRVKHAAEHTAKTIFALCAAVAVFGVCSITLYMIISGVPAITKIGLKEILLGRLWAPAAADPKYGIFYVILTSVVGTAMAVLLGVPPGILTAVFLAQMPDGRIPRLVRQAVRVMAGVPSVLYGLLGVYLLNPAMYKLERFVFAGSRSHRFTGGANLLSAAIVLAIMLLPTVVSIGEASIRAVSPGIQEASLGLGASRVQTMFKAVLPAAKPGILTAVGLGLGRAFGEAMAVTLVSGSSVNIPLPFQSVRFLTTAIVNEMGYAQGTHRQMLFAIGLVLFLFIMLTNIVLNKVNQKGSGLYD